MKKILMIILILSSCRFDDSDNVPVPVYEQDAQDIIYEKYIFQLRTESPCFIYISVGQLSKTFYAYRGDDYYFDVRKGYYYASVNKKDGTYNPVKVQLIHLYCENEVCKEVLLASSGGYEPYAYFNLGYINE